MVADTHTILYIILMMQEKSVFWNMWCRELVLYNILLAHFICMKPHGENYHEEPSGSSLFYTGKRMEYRIL